jgi:hypothetical protein
VTEVTTDPADATTKLRPVTIDTTREGVHSDQDVDELRDAMVDDVIVREWLGLDPPREVEAALRTVPRHLFAPGVPLEKAYADAAIVTKRNERGNSISSVSAPWLQAGCWVSSRWRRGRGFWRSDPVAITPRCFGNWSGRTAR